ncbi:MAG: hypothetical protein RLZZ140_698 [Pseudomonadota bacterium]
MPKQAISVINELGLHLRASSKLSQLATRFPCEVWLSRNSKRVNAKSIETLGEQADEALAALVDLFASKFGEDA